MCPLVDMCPGTTDLLLYQKFFTSVREQLVPVRAEGHGLDVAVHFQCERPLLGPGAEEVDVSEPAVECDEVSRRRDREALHAALLQVPGHSELLRLPRVHVVGVEVAVVLGADDELPAVGGEVGSLDGKVLKVDGLHLGVGLSINL